MIREPEPSGEIEQAFQQLYYSRADRDRGTYRELMLTGNFRVSKMVWSARPGYRIMVEVRSTHRSHLVDIRAAYQSLIASLKPDVVIDPIFVVPGHWDFCLPETGLEVRLKQNMIFGRFSTKWDDIEYWGKPRLTEQVAKRLIRHGVNDWRVGERLRRTVVSPALYLTNDSDFVMAKMLL